MKYFIKLSAEVTGIKSKSSGLTPKGLNVSAPKPNPTGKSSKTLKFSAPSKSKSDGGSTMGAKENGTTV